MDEINQRFSFVSVETQKTDDANLTSIPVVVLTEESTSESDSGIPSASEFVSILSTECSETEIPAAAKSSNIVTKPDCVWDLCFYQYVPFSGRASIRRFTNDELSEFADYFKDTFVINVCQYISTFSSDSQEIDPSHPQNHHFLVITTSDGYFSVEQSALGITIQHSAVRADVTDKFCNSKRNATMFFREKARRYSSFKEIVNLIYSNNELWLCYSFHYSTYLTIKNRRDFIQRLIYKMSVIECGCFQNEPDNFPEAVITCVRYSCPEDSE